MELTVPFQITGNPFQISHSTSFALFPAFLGFSVQRHSTSVQRNNQSASTIAAVIADSVSLSPNFISDTDTVSFSFTIGITEDVNKETRVFVALI